MRTSRDWSIRDKLTGLFVAMACIAAITVSVPMGVFDLLGLRRAMARDLATLADVLARNSTAALTFRDVHAAQDVLQALRAEPSVTAACIYSDDGKPFATYVRQAGEIPILCLPLPKSRPPGSNLAASSSSAISSSTVKPSALSTLNLTCND